MASLDGFIEETLKQIIDITANLKTDSLTQTMETFVGSTLNPTTNGTISNFTTLQDIMKNTVFAIGASMFSLFMLMELVSIIDRSSGGENGLGGIKLPAHLLIKWGVFSFLYCNLGKILLGIQAVSVQLATSISVSSLTTNTNAVVGTIMGTVSSLGLIEQLCVLIIVVIIWLLVQIMVILMNVVVIFRMFEMLIFYMFAPIPLATFPSQEFKQTALNFLKSFVAITLQGAIILGCFKIYNLVIIGKINAVVSGMTGSYTSSVSIIGTVLLPIVGYLVVLATAVAKSGSIAKSLINAS